LIKTLILLNHIIIILHHFILYPYLFFISKSPFLISTIYQKIKFWHMLNIIHISPVPIVIIPIPIKLLNFQPFINLIHIQKLFQLILLRSTSRIIFPRHLFHYKITYKLSTLVFIVREVNIHHQILRYTLPCTVNPHTQGLPFHFKFIVLHVDVLYFFFSVAVWHAIFDNPGWVVYFGVSVWFKGVVVYFLVVDSVTEFARVDYGLG